MNLYLIGSMKNQHIPVIAKSIREKGHDVFDDWFSPGKDADWEWQRYEGIRGRSYQEALSGHHAKTVFDFDKRHLDLCDAACLVTPAGRSAHIELGYVIGLGKPGYVLFDKEPDHFDIMYRFATKVCMSLEELVQELGACAERPEPGGWIAFATKKEMDDYSKRQR